MFIFPIDMTERLSELFAQPQVLLKMAAEKIGLGLEAWPQKGWNLDSRFFFVKQAGKYLALSGRLV